MPAELPGLIRCGGRDLGHPAKTLRYLGMELPSLIEIAELLGASLALYALYLILLIVHEAGHCVAGFLLGLRLISVKVGPVRFERPNAWKWDLRWNAFFKGAEFGAATQHISLLAQWRTCALEFSRCHSR